MKRFIILGGVGILASLGMARLAPSRQVIIDRPAGHIFVPPSSVVHPGDGIFGNMHTNLLVFVPDDQPPSSVPPPSANTPASLACVYQLVTPLVDGCPINGTTVNPTGGSGAIGIVDAYYDPNIENDLGVFDSQFGLPSCTTANGCLTTAYGGLKQPENANLTGWDLEESLDVEWSHAMAPNAKIIFVQAENNSFTALLTAVEKASNMVKAAGGGEVSMSWIGGEAKSELKIDPVYFRRRGVVFFASSGDGGSGVGYPSASPDVVAAGGTDVNRSAGNFTTETGWNGSGGGPSQFEPRPVYQNTIQSIVGNFRGVPDISFDADPATGVAVYDTDTPTDQWVQVGGTSVSSPSLAGVINAAGLTNKFSGHSSNFLQTVYNEYSNPKRYAAYYRDITSGSNGQYQCEVGWDFVTGVGSLITYTEK
jgi:kumamolisin